jgi:hypothetical protein
MAKNQTVDVAAAAVAAETTEAAAAPVSRIPYGRRVSFSILEKPYQSGDKAKVKRRYIGQALYAHVGATDAVTPATISVLESADGGRKVELLFPSGMNGRPDPIMLTSKEAKEEFAAWKLRENAAASAWIESLPIERLRSLLLGDLSGGSSVPAMLNVKL